MAARGRWRHACGVLTVVVATACGYGFRPDPAALPADARTISIALFENETRERGLEVQLRQAIEEEFRRRGALQVVETGGDLRLEGRMRRLANIPVAFAGANEAVEFQARLVVAFRLIDARTGHVVRGTRQLLETADFAAVRNVVVGSSPAFQEDTADARDLAHLTNVGLTESNRARARRQLVAQMAVHIYLAAVEGF